MIKIVHINKNKVCAKSFHSFFCSLSLQGIIPKCCSNVFLNIVPIVMDLLDIHNVWPSQLLCFWQTGKVLNMRKLNIGCQTVFWLTQQCLTTKEHFISYQHGPLVTVRISFLWVWSDLARSAKLLSSHWDLCCLFFIVYRKCYQKRKSIRSGGYPRRHGK